MTNENELKVSDVNNVLESLSLTNQRFCNIYGKDSSNSKSIIAAIRLINSQQSRIELCESAICEFLKANDKPHREFMDLLPSIRTLRDLME